ncbi:MAG: thioredoxin family protein [Muribaculaceae bacterium]|nr:thioredoxin family protein [Muribaculaceae bacterium]
MKKRNILGAAMLATIAGACSGPQGWSVEGTIAADAGTKIALEGYNNGIWYLVDSITPGADGSFAYRSAEAAAYPEIMRLSGGGLAAPVFFPVDGSDAVRVQADGRVSGTALAAAMSRVDSIVASAGARLGSAAAFDPELRRLLGQAAIDDTTSIIAYYVLNKSIGGHPVFDPSETFGSRIYGAVAQNFATNRPDDPRGAMIRAVYLEGRKALGKGLPTTAAADSTLQVSTSGLIDIVRYDDRGNRHSLAELAEKGDVVLLSFTSYQSDFSPSYSLLLKEVYDKYHDKGLEIYQIAFDNDEVLWKESARNLPWITVYNAPTDGITPLSSYNVGSLPLTFVIDRQGTVRSRVADPRKLDKELQKLF